MTRGRDISVSDDRHRLPVADTRQAIYPWELPNELEVALEKATPPKFSKKFNSEV